MINHKLCNSTKSVKRVLMNLKIWSWVLGLLVAMETWCTTGMEANQPSHTFPWAILPSLVEVSMYHLLFLFKGMTSSWPTLNLCIRNLARFGLGESTSHIYAVGDLPHGDMPWSPRFGPKPFGVCKRSQRYLSNNEVYFPCWIQWTPYQWWAHFSSYFPGGTIG